MPDAAQSGGTARPHGDSVHRQFAVLRDQHRRQILDAHAGPSGDDDDVRVGVQGFEDGVAIVANQAGEIDNASVALDQRREHRPVGIGDMKAMRARAGWQQFVACHCQAHARPADHARLSLPNGTEDAQILWAQHASRLKQRRAADDVFADACRHFFQARRRPER